jgi:hypothetical protein
VDHVFPNMITEKDYPNLSVLKLNGVPWLFGLEVETFSEFQVASQREYLDLLVVHLEKERGAKRTLLVDAGEIYEPNMLSRYLQRDQVAFLSLPEEMALSIWKSRAWATEMLRKYDNPDKLFRRWMEFDKIITERILRQCRELNLPVFLRDQDTPAQILLERVETIFCNRLK